MADLPLSRIAVSGLRNLKLNKSTMELRATQLPLGMSTTILNGIVKFTLMHVRQGIPTVLDHVAPSEPPSA
jgi:hypothetical protein